MKCHWVQFRCIYPIEKEKKKWCIKERNDCLKYFQFYLMNGRHADKIPSKIEVKICPFNLSCSWTLINPLYRIQLNATPGFYSNLPCSLRAQVSTKSCFMKQKCHIQIVVAQYKNAATPLSTSGINTTRQHFQMKYITLF